MDEIKKLTVKLIELKERSYDINEEIRKVEGKIIDLMGHNTEGTRTIQMDGMSISTVGKVTRTVDQKKLKDIWANLPEFVRKDVIKFKPTINLANYRELRNIDEELWYQLNTAIVSKPAKTAVSIKIFEGDEN